MTLAFSLSSCGLDIGDQDLLNLIKIQRGTWNSAGVGSYAFTYSRTPMDCPAIDVTPAVRITVLNGEVASVFVPSSGISEQVISVWPTMEEIFNQMYEDASQTTRVFGQSYANQNSPPAFDEDYGFPSSYYFDVTDMDCDALAVNITDFEEL